MLGRKLVIGWQWVLRRKLVLRRQRVPGTKMVLETMTCGCSAESGCSGFSLVLGLLLRRKQTQAELDHDLN